MPKNETIALDMVAQGFTVIKLHPGTKVPAEKGWRDDEKCQYLDNVDVGDWGDANVGIVMTPGLFTIDVDGGEGAKQFRKLTRAHPKLPTTLSIKTTSGDGQHRVFSYDPEKWSITNAQRGLKQSLGLGRDDKCWVDIRGTGGQIVAPGCTVVYEPSERFPEGHTGTSKITKKREPATAPDWLLEILTQEIEEQDDFKVEPISDRDYDEVIDALQHVGAVDYDGWVRVGMALHTTGRPEAFGHFDEWSSKQYGYKGKDDCAAHWRSFRSDNSTGAVTTYKSIYFDAKETGWEPKIPAVNLSKLVGTAPEMEAIEEPEGLAEILLQNAKGFDEGAIRKRVIYHLGGRVRYVNEWGGWMVWTGNVWEHDTTNMVSGMIHAALEAEADDCRARFQELRYGDKDEKAIADKLIAAAGRLGGWRMLDSTVKLIQKGHDIAKCIQARTDIWDQEHELLNTPAGPFDLRTGEKVKQALTRYCSQSTSVAPKKGRPVRWLAFLKEVFPDAETRDYVQCFMGYAATGYTREHCLLFAHGSGANGKGAMFNTLKNVLGTYAKVVDPGMFTLAGSYGHKSDLAALMGRRFVLSQEVPEGMTWNEARIKMLASGDDVEANFMRGNKFDFTPQCSIVICSNPKPMFKSVDDAIKRRFKLLEFDQSFVGKEDRRLPEKLAEEAGEILNWIMDGAKRYLQDGLKTPSSMAKKTDAYLGQADATMMWLEDAIVPEEEVNGEKHYHPLKYAFSNYREFCKSMGMKPVSRPTFQELLLRRGGKSRRLIVQQYHPEQRQYWGPLSLDRIVRH